MGFIVTKKSSLTGFLPFYLLFLQITYEKENNILEINEAEDKTILFLQGFFFYTQCCRTHKNGVLARTNAL